MAQGRRQRAAAQAPRPIGRVPEQSEEKTEDSQIADRAHALLRQRDGGEGSEEWHEERGPADGAGNHRLGVAGRALVSASWSWARRLGAQHSRVCTALQYLGVATRLRFQSLLRNSSLASEFS